MRINIRVEEFFTYLGLAIFSFFLAVVIGHEFNPEGILFACVSAMGAGLSYYLVTRDDGMSTEWTNGDVKGWLVVLLALLSFIAGLII